MHHGEFEQRLHIHKKVKMPIHMDVFKIDLYQESWIEEK